MKKLIAWLLLALAFALMMQGCRPAPDVRQSEARIADAAEALAREAARFNANFLEQQRLLLVWRDSAYGAMQDTVLALQARLALAAAENRFLLRTPTRSQRKVP